MIIALVVLASLALLVSLLTLLMVVQLTESQSVVNRALTGMIMNRGPLLGRIARRVGASDDRV